MIVLNSPRKVLLELVKRANTDLKAVSGQLGKNHAYLQQYIARGTPRVLSDKVRQNLGRILGVDPNVFLEEHDPKRIELNHMASKSASKAITASEKPSAKQVQPIAREERNRHYGNMCHIAEYDMFHFLKYGKKAKPLSFWGLPREYVEHYTAEPDNLALICVCGDGMAPEYQDGDYVLVDLASKHPSTSGLYLLHDGVNIMLKNIEILLGSKPEKVRLVSANPIYGSYDVAFSQLTICGRVVGRWRWQ